MVNNSTVHWARRLLQDNPALFVSAVYLLASAIGLIYSWAFLSAFGINVFRYAEISDFLLASLKEPFTWVVTILAVCAVLFDNATSRRVEARNPSRLFAWYGSARYRRLNYLVMVGAVVFFLLLIAQKDSTAVRNNASERVDVELGDGTVHSDRLLLGTTGRFVFVFDPKAETVEIHPHESILTIVKPAPE